MPVADRVYRIPEVDHLALGPWARGFRPPAPARPPPGAARRSCPWRGRGRWQRPGQRGLRADGRSGGIAGPARGGSGPRAGACPVRRPGPGPAGSGLRPARHRGDRRGHGRRQAGAARAPRCTLFVLPGQVERLAGVLPGLLAASRQTTDLAEPCDPEGTISQRARADSFADRLLQQHAPLSEVPLQLLQRQPVDACCQDGLDRGCPASPGGVVTTDRPLGCPPVPRSRPGCAHSPPERRGCLPYAQSAAV